MGLILFPPCFTTISGGLTLDRSTGNCQSSGICHRGRLLLTSALLLCLVRPLIMWLSPSCLLVVYALGRTHIDVSLSCLYGVPLVYARGRTHIDRALAWLRGVPFMFSTLIFFVLFLWCTVVYAHGRTYIDVSFSCLYGVPLVYARGRTTLIGLLRGVPFMFSTLILCRLVCMVYRCVRTRSYLHWRVLLLFVWCTVSVRTRSYSHW